MESGKVDESGEVLYCGTNMKNGMSTPITEDRSRQPLDGMDSYSRSGGEVVGYFNVVHDQAIAFIGPIGTHHC
jgi:hypothetical protein